MRSPLVQLLTARRFAPLFVTQFLGAFNDNLLKSAMGIVVTFRLAEQSGQSSAIARHAGRRGLHCAVLPLLGRIGHTGRSRRQVVHRSHRQGRRDLHHDAWRGGPLAGKRAAPLRGALLPRHTFDRLRPDQVRPASAAPARRRTGRGQRAHRGGHIPRDPAGHDPRWQRGPARQRGAHRGRLRRCQCVPGLARRASDPAGATLGCRCASPAPAARHDRRRRSRDVASGVAAAHPRGVLVLAVWRHRGVGTAGVCQGRPLRERAGGDDDAGALRCGCRRRIDCRRAAAARRGERALRAGRGRRDGVLRLGSARGQRRPPVGRRTGDRLGLPALAGKLAHSRGPGRRRDGGRSLHGAALRDPAARKRAGASRARDRGQQHHQRPRDGDRRGWRRCRPRPRVDDGRAVRAVRTDDHPCRARGGVDPAADDGEEPRCD